MPGGLPVSGGPLPGLSGLRVVDFSDDVAGAYCAKLLTDAGADVARVEPPEGIGLRRWSVSGRVGVDGDPDGALFRFLAASQRSLVADPARRWADSELDHLVGASDVAIVSAFRDRKPEPEVGDPPEVLGPPAVDAARLADRHPELVVVSISAFGLTGPRGGETSSDFLLQALAGSLHTHGSVDREPLAVGGAMAAWAAGTFAALGAVAALTGRRRSGRGDLVDVSALECLAVTFVCYPSVVASLPGGRRRRGTFLMVPGVERCKDGYVGFSTITTAQWHTFLEMIGRSDLAEDASLWNQLKRGRPDVLDAIDRWTRERTVDEVVELGSVYRIPTVPIGNGEIFPRLEHVVARRLYDDNPRGGFPHPRPPFRSSATEPRPPGAAPVLGGTCPADRRPGGPAEPAPQAPRPFAGGRRPDGPGRAASGLPLRGVRVLDFTAFLAGPMCTQYLAALGADVVKIESIQRPDPMRFTVRVDASVDRWYELGGIYQSANLDKRSVTLNLADPRGRDLALRIAASADVVVENFTPRVMDHFGLTFEDLRAVNPRIVMVRMPGFGLEGPWSDRPGFASTMEQVSGLAWITGYRDGLPTIPGICDPLAGMHAAFAVLCALEHRERTGAGQLVELAMIDLTAHLVAEQVLEHAVYGHLMTREGSRGPGSAHQGVYRSCDPDRWVAVRVGGDGWRGLPGLLGWPDRSIQPLAFGTERTEAADRIDDALASWCEQRSQKDAVGALRSSGIEAEPVVASYDIDADEQMNSRGFWLEVVHPIAGPVRYPGWPTRFASRPEPWFERPAPLLGQHTDEVLRTVGVSEAELAELRDDEVIGTRPVGL